MSIFFSSIAIASQDIVSFDKIFSATELLQVIDVNLKGTFLMTQTHSKHLLKQLTTSSESASQPSGLNGSIVNIASASAKVFY